MNKFNKLFNTLIKESQDWQDQDQDDVWDEVQDGLRQCLEENIDSVVGEMDLTDGQYEALQEAGLVGFGPSPDTFDECIQDSDVDKVIQELLKDESDENWEKVDIAIYNWVKEAVDSILSNYENYDEQEEDED